MYYMERECEWQFNIMVVTNHSVRMQLRNKSFQVWGQWYGQGQYPAGRTGAILAIKEGLGQGPIRKEPRTDEGGKLRECILQTAVHIPEWENGSSVRVCELHSNVRAWPLYTHNSIPEQLRASTVDKESEFLVSEAYRCPRLMRIKWQGQNVNLAGSSVPCSPTLVPSASLTAGFCWFWWQTRRDSYAQWLLLRCTLFYCESVVQYDEQVVNQKLGEWINKLKLCWSLPHIPEGIMKTSPLFTYHIYLTALTTGPISETLQKLLSQGPFLLLSPGFSHCDCGIQFYVYCTKLWLPFTEDTPSISQLQSHWMAYNHHNDKLSLTKLNCSLWGSF